MQQTFLSHVLFAKTDHATNKIILHEWEFMSILQEELNIQLKEVKVEGLWPKLS